MAGSLAWASDTSDLLTATLLDTRNRALLRVVVERLPGGGWDWAAWSNDNTRRSLHGVAALRDEAVAAAADAAASISRVQVLSRAA